MARAWRIVYEWGTLSKVGEDSLYLLLEAPRFVLLAKFLGGIGTCTLLAVEGCVG